VSEDLHWKILEDRHRKILEDYYQRRIREAIEERSTSEGDADAPTYYVPIRTSRAVEQTESLKVGGFVICPYGGPIDWQPKKKLSVATSTTKAEYAACTEVWCKARYLIQLYKDTGKFATLPIYRDRSGALKGIRSGVSSEKTKHIDIQFHDSRELHAQGRVKFTYASTDVNLADIMTKALTLGKVFNDLSKEWNWVHVEDCNVGIAVSWHSFSEQLFSHWVLLRRF